MKFSGGTQGGKEINDATIVVGGHLKVGEEYYRVDKEVVAFVGYELPAPPHVEPIETGVELDSGVIAPEPEVIKIEEVFGDDPITPEPEKVSFWRRFF